MKTQRCPACGARYDASRLEDGTRFDCRRCGGLVTVGAPYDPAAVEGNGRVAPGLFVAGAAMLAATFLIANPAFGTRALAWPWEQWQEALSPARRWTAALWAAAAIHALVAALLPSARRRGVLALALGAVLLVATSLSPDADYATEPLGGLPWMLGAVALGAGLLAARHGGGGTARLLALAGAILVPWAHAGTSWRDLAALGAAALGLLVALGAPGRAIPTLGFLLLLAAMLLPGAIALGEAAAREDGVSDALRAVGADLPGQAVRVLVGGGLALWLLSACAASDLVRATRAPR